MEKSIETIWKEGFLKSDALVAPKLNNLYNQKSKHTIDKLMRMGEINLVAIMIGAFSILVGSIFAGAAYIHREISAVHSGRRNATGLS